VLPVMMSSLAGVITSVLLTQPVDHPSFAASSAQKRVVVPSAEQDLQAYHSLVMAYRRGDDEAVRKILEWNRRRIEETLALVNRGSDPWRPWDPVRVAAAAMLHTDGAIHLVESGKGDQAFDQLASAGRLLEITADGSDIRPFAARWYVAVSRYLRGIVELAVSERLLEHGRSWLPGDPRVLFESGTLQELLAGRPSIAPLPSASETDAYSTRRLTEAVRRMTVQRGHRLSTGREWLRKSLDADGSNAETRLHLGRVLMLQGDDRQALEIFQSVRSAADRSVTYLAILFTGGVHERRGTLGNAVDSYQEAVTILPQAQAAYVALSEALQRSGRGDHARAVLEKLLAEPREPRHEPFWTYFFEPTELVHNRLAELRAESRR
jgi:tetratricopeptide (TPR) repeat protein